jgi:gliding motility-associated-like protein
VRLGLFFFLLLATAIFSPVVYSQNCPQNIGFEAGNFTGWECFTGTTKVDSGKNKIVLLPSAPTNGRHEIISANNTSLLDPWGLFPKLCPFGGNYSVKLGNNVGGAQAEGLSYTFPIPAGADSFTITYFYAVVLQNPSHSSAEQPRFIVSAYDVQTGDQVSCNSFNYVASGAIPGFQQSPIDTSVVYKSWTPASLQLAGLGGRTVRLEFKTADCTQGQHFGYAYIDVNSTCSSVVAAASFCAQSNSLILDAPHGLQSYTWYDSNYVVVGNRQSVTLSPPPVNSGTYFVGVVPYPGFGCPDTLKAIVKQAPTPDTPGGRNYFVHCQGYPVPSLTATASQGNTLLWYTTPTGGTPSSIAPIPPRDSTGFFEYYVAQKALLGCEGPRKKITVKMTPAPAISFTVNNVRQCQGKAAIFRSTSTGLSNAVFFWDFGDGEKQSSAIDTVVTHTYANAGNYLVRLRIVNDSACFSERNMVFAVVPKPNAQFTYPSNICEQQTPLTFIDNSTVPGNGSPVNSWWWNINGTVVTTQSPASATANMGGSMPVQFVVTTAEGCVSDTNKTFITVRHRPRTNFEISNLCENETSLFADRSEIPSSATGESIVKWQWVFDTTYNSSTRNSSLNLTAGSHMASLVVETNYGCRSLPKDSSFTVHPKPNISFTRNDSCVNRTILFSGNDLGGNVNKWIWSFGTGGLQNGVSVGMKFNAEGTYPVTMVAQTQQGCKDTISRSLIIYGNKAFAGRDTIASNNDPVQLNANGGTNVIYAWSPSTGLNNPNIENPVAVLDKDQRYELFAVNDKGCESRSSILIKRFDKSTIYIPSGFTPNGDGKNDILKVVPVGIKSFKYFTVYNRWGEIIFKSRDASKGWDGTCQGLAQPTGTFVVLAEGIDYRGRTVVEKATVTLIR